MLLTKQNLCVNIFRHLERYRSGHNGTVLKTVDSQGSVGSNPTLSAKKSKSADLDFFIHCESNGISSAVRLYIINNGIAVVVSHHPKGVYKPFRNDDIQFLRN